MHHLLQTTMLDITTNGNQCICHLGADKAEFRHGSSLELSVSRCRKETAVYFSLW